VGIFSIYPTEVSSSVSMPGVELWHHNNSRIERGKLAQKFERRLNLLKPEYPYARNLYTRKALSQLTKCVQDFRPDLIIVEELWFYPYLPSLHKIGCPIILDSHNLETILFRDLHKAKGRSPSGLQYWLQHWRDYRLQQVEQRMVQSVSQNWVCSLEDKQGLEKLYSPAPCWVIPNGIDIEEYQPVKLKQVIPPPDLQHPQPTVLFLGTLAYGPNIEAVKWLLTDIYPLLQQAEPNCRLLLVGRNPQRWIRTKAKNTPNIWVTGAVKDVRPYMAAAQVMVVPLKQGGGTRLKILEAFAAGCPVVSTAKGAEGLQAEDGTHLLIRNTTTDITTAILQLWQQPSLAKRLSTSAFELAEQTYSREAIARPIRAALQSLGFDPKD
jgi:glycosyltransferase involved in cell wall biosynthesis